MSAPRALPVANLRAGGWGSMSAGRRIGVSASGEVRLLFDTAIMTRRSRRSWWSSANADTPTRFPRRPIFNATTSPFYARRYTGIRLPALLHLPGTCHAGARPYRRTYPNVHCAMGVQTGI